MPLDDTTPPEGGALSPAEVAARVSAILAAAERDARAVIEAAQREPAPAPAPPRTPPTLEGLAHAVDELALRVEALERGAVYVAPPEPQPVPQPAPEPEPTAGEIATRVRVIDLALAGYSRESIAHELAAALPADEIERLLDQVLAR